MNYYPTNTKDKKIEKAIQDKNKRIDKFVDRKERNIAFLNSVNSAISLLAPNVKEISREEMQEHIIFWREWFYSEWEKWVEKSQEDIAEVEEKPANELPFVK